MYMGETLHSSFIIKWFWANNLLRCRIDFRASRIRALRSLFYNNLLVPSHRWKNVPTNYFNPNYAFFILFWNNFRSTNGRAVEKMQDQKLFAHSPVLIKTMKLNNINALLILELPFLGFSMNVVFPIPGLPFRIKNCILSFCHFNFSKLIAWFFFF